MVPRYPLKNNILPYGVKVSTEDSKSFSLSSNLGGAAMDIIFKYKDKIISTPNLDKKLKRMNITLDDIEIIQNLEQKVEIEDNWKRPLVYLKSTLDNYIYTVYSESKPDNPFELIKNLIWNGETGIKNFTEEYVKTLIYV